MNTFNLHRLSLLLKKEFIEKGRLMLFAFLGMLCIICIAIFYPIIFKNVYFPTNEIIAYYFIGLFLFGILLGNFAFSDLAEKPKAVSYLVLPATSLEKFLTKYLIYSVLFFIVYTGIFYLLSKISVNLYTQIFVKGDTQYFGVQEIYKFDDLLKLLPIFFLVQLGFYLGTLYFKKYAFMLSVLSVSAIVLFIYVYTTQLNGMVNNLEPTKTFTFNNKGVNKFGTIKSVPVEYFYALPQWFFIVSKIVFSYLSIPFFCFVTWLKLKEKELK